MGIIFIKYHTHEEAKRCLEKENGRKGGLPGVIIPSVALTVKSGAGGSTGEADIGGEEDEVIKVVYDDEGLILTALMREMEERRKKDKKKRESLTITNARVVAPMTATHQQQQKKAAVTPGPSIPTPLTMTASTPVLGAIDASRRISNFPPNTASPSTMEFPSLTQAVSSDSTVVTNPNCGSSSSGNTSASSVLSSSVHPTTAATATTTAMANIMTAVPAPVAHATTSSLTTPTLKLPPGLPQRPSVPLVDTPSSTHQNAIIKASRISNVTSGNYKARSSSGAGGGEPRAVHMVDGMTPSSGDYEREREREREKDRERDRERDRGRRERERYGYGGNSYLSRRGDHYQPSPYNNSSRSPSPYPSYSSYTWRDRERERERDRNWDRDRERERERERDYDRAFGGSARGGMKKTMYEIEQEREDRRNETLKRLFENGFDYVKIAKEGGSGFSANLVGNVRDEEVCDYFEGFYPDQVKESCFFLMVFE